MQAALMFTAHLAIFPSMAGLLPLAWPYTALHGMPKGHYRRAAGTLITGKNRDVQEFVYIR